MSVSISLNGANDAIEIEIMQTLWQARIESETPWNTCRVRACRRKKQCTELLAGATGQQSLVCHGLEDDAPQTPQEEIADEKLLADFYRLLKEDLAARGISTP